MATTLAELKLHSRGKVREIYELDDDLLLVASDRISAYDVVLPDPIPDKGQGPDPDVDLLVRPAGRRLPQPLPLRGRPPRGGRARDAGTQARDVPRRVRRPRLPLGSGWRIPHIGRSLDRASEGLTESDKLPEPIFTPATKAEIGDHDENIDFERAAEIVGDRALMEDAPRGHDRVLTTTPAGTRPSAGSSSPTPSSSSGASPGPRWSSPTRC